MDTPYTKTNTVVPDLEAATERAREDTPHTKTNTAVPDLEAATERAREANERLLEEGRKVSNAYFDGVEKYVAGLVKLERKIGEQSQVEAVASLFDTHAKLTEDVVKASVSAARELITA
jgi:hypothetical protein